MQTVRCSLLPALLSACLLVVALSFSGCGPGQAFGPTLTPPATNTPTSTPTLHEHTHASGHEHTHANIHQHTVAHKHIYLYAYQYIDQFAYSHADIDADQHTDTGSFGRQSDRLYHERRAYCSCFVSCRWGWLVHYQSY